MEKSNIGYLSTMFYNLKNRHTKKVLQRALFCYNTYKLLKMVSIKK